MQTGLLGRPAVVAGIGAGSALLALYFIGHYLVAGTREGSVIELVTAAGCLLGAIACVARTVEMTRRSVGQPQAGEAEDSVQWGYISGLIGLVVGSCIGLIGGISLHSSRAGIVAFTIGCGILTAAVCAGIFLAAARGRRRS